MTKMDVEDAGRGHALIPLALCPLLADVPSGNALRFRWRDHDPGYRHDWLADLDAHDVEHPIPCPPPMTGQVWVWPGGEENVIGKVYSREVGGCLFANGLSYSAEQWPPLGAVLVLGPTPWGRDVPWMPAGRAS